MKISWIYKLNQFLLPLFLIINLTVFSQDGEKLFKANCASCHNPIKNATGPKMQGAKDKWINAGEGDLIYEWVKNPSELYSSGKSKMAKAIWDYSPTAMTAQGHLSNEEIDAVFAYVDAYTAPVAVDSPTESGSGTKDEDSSAFWWWIIGAVLVIIIFSITGVRRQLSYALAEKEGNPIDPNIPTGEHVRAWMVKNWFAFVLILVSVLIISGVELGTRAYQVGVVKDYQPSQTIAYSHKSDQI